MNPNYPQSSSPGWASSSQYPDGRQSMYASSNAAGANPYGGGVPGSYVINLPPPGINNLGSTLAPGGINFPGPEGGSPYGGGYPYPGVGGNMPMGSTLQPPDADPYRRYSRRRALSVSGGSAGGYGSYPYMNSGGGMMPGQGYSASYAGSAYGSPASPYHSRLVSEGPPPNVMRLGEPGPYPQQLGVPPMMQGPGLMPSQQPPSNTVIIVPSSRRRRKHHHHQRHHSRRARSLERY
ncbi:hypothetical protein HGRIS_006167 [Hohenbuehelia grisea]|uniref:Uncharacterized protein n=1 Tax=Hohenbuehelia grisea TaxID=104357 RepID=A0ABR3K1P9_9AGAR